jgi:CHAT domain-containing protein/tetratricopeptide (TPR) repeat protein
MESLATVVRLRIEESERPDTLVLAEAWLAIAASRSQRNLFADSLGLQAASRSLALCRANGVAGDSMLAEVHSALANAYSGQRAYRSELVHRGAVLTLRRRTLADDDPLIAHALFNLGGAYRRVGELDSALVVYREALDFWLRHPTERNNWIGDLYSEIGLVRELQGEDDLAEQAYEAGIRAHEELLGPDDPAVSFSLHRAGGFAFRRGDTAKVIDYTERSVRILSRQLPAEAEDLVFAKINLAQCYRQLGDPARALVLLDEVLPRFEHVLAPEALSAGRISQALSCADLGPQERALSLLEEVRLASAGDSLRAESTSLPFALNSEAAIRFGQGEKDLALRLAQEAVAVNRRLAVPDLQLAMEALTMEMSILSERGDWTEVERLDQELETVLSEVSTRTGESYAKALVSRSEVADRRGRAAEAFEKALEAARLRRENLILNVRALSDRQALGLSTAASAPLDQLLLLGSRADSSGLRRAWDELVRWRGLVRTEVGRRRLPTPMVDHPSFVAAHSSWLRAQRRLAQFEVRAASQARDATTDSTLSALRAAADEAERHLARDFPGTHASDDADAISLRSILTALAPDQALISFVQSPGVDDERHLVAFVAQGGSAMLRSFDLGEVGEIETLVARWKARLGEIDPGKRSEEECRRSGSRVRERVWDPVHPATGGALDLFLVPEEPLTGLPWGALPEGSREYLVDSGTRVHVLESEREILRGKDGPMGAGILAVGGIDYDREDSSGPPAEPTFAANFRAPISECDRTALANLRPLPGTRQEVRDIQAIWDRSELSSEPVVRLEGGRATELEFKRWATNQRILHLATHGVVLSDSCRASAFGTRGVGGIDPVSEASDQAIHPKGGTTEAKSSPRTSASAASSRRTPHLSGRPNPSPWLGRRLLLALANANHARERASDENEGLLTAEEVTTLDLSGVEWVVLSACQSAAGEAWAREGVLGMQRAFHIAGARTVIASQWSVDDEATLDWMRALYEARARGVSSAGAAIAAASQTVLDARRRSKRSTHPFYWAAFTASGE